MNRRSPLIDAIPRVTGQIDYTLDVTRPGMLHARVVRSPYAHARLLRVDAGAAREVPGVAAVLTRDELPGLVADPVYGPQIKDQPVVAVDRVRYVGDVVAAIAAETPEAAEAAALLVEAEYEELPAVFDPLAAMAPDAPQLHDLPAEWEGSAAYFDMRPVPGTNCCHRFRIRHGDVEAGLAAADLVLTRTYTTPAAAHIPMEPHVAVAEWTAPLSEGERLGEGKTPLSEGGPEGTLTVWAATQTPFNTRDALAAMFGLPAGQVRVIVASLGGSYGSKTFPRAEPIAAALARQTGRPVRLVFRREELWLTLNRHPSAITITLGLRRDGRLLAKRVEASWGTGAYADCGPGVAQKGGYGAVGPYNIPNVAVESDCVYTNLPPNGAYRGYAVTQAAWASECMMDEAAEALGLDPLEFRLKNLLHDGDRWCTGEVMHGVHFEECLRAAAAAIGWGEPVPAPPAGGTLRITHHGELAPPSRLVRGRGLCVLLKGMTTPSRSTAAVELDAQGCITLRFATIEMGQGARTVLAQLAAEPLGLPYDQLRIATVDTTITPRDNRTTSSRSTYMMGNALDRASRSLAGRLKAAAAEMLEANPADLTLQDGAVLVRGAPGRRASFDEIVRASGERVWLATESFVNEGGLDPDSGQGIASSHWHQGAGAVEVEVDTGTGKVELLRVHAAIYAGRVVNRLSAELQNEGSMLMGIGSALFEAIEHDGGQITNANLSDYMICSFLDLPRDLTHNLLEHPGADIHGLGETALPTIPAAAGNAVARATGARIRDLPLTPERVLGRIIEMNG